MVKKAYNNEYYFVIYDDKNIVNKYHVEGVMRDLEDSEDIEDYTNNENGICDKDHSSPCGVDTECEF